MTRLGDFWKFSATTFIAKVAQLIGKLFGHFEKQQLKVKTIVSTFLATFEDIGLLFILPFGHTEFMFLVIMNVGYCINEIAYPTYSS